MMIIILTVTTTTITHIHTHIGMVEKVPVGHGSLKLKREALDEVVLRVMHLMRANDVKLPYCAFNGGRDAWFDIGDKAVGVASLKSWLGLESEQVIHVGDQFLNVGNDIKAREECPCLWITTPKETARMLGYIMEFCKVNEIYSLQDVMTEPMDGGVGEPVMDVFTGDMIMK